MRTNVVGVAIVAGVLSGGMANAQSPGAACKLTPTVTSSSQTILPGEPLDLAFVLTNSSGTDISLETPSETSGTVRVGIAGTGEPPAFKRYLGPGWGTEDAVRAPRPLANGGTIRVSLRILYQVQRLQPYTFATAGMFRLKVRYQDESVCPGGTETPMFTVHVVEPRGDDLAVWNAIKDCSRCGHFLHTGRASSNKVSQDAVALMRTLAKQYPKSRYTTFIRKQLDALDESSRKKHCDDDKHHDD